MVNEQCKYENALLVENITGRERERWEGKGCETYSVKRGSFEMRKIVVDVKYLEYEYIKR